MFSSFLLLLSTKGWIAGFRSVYRFCLRNYAIFDGDLALLRLYTVNPTKDPYDERGNLYKQMVRVVAAKQPKAFVAENVKGFMTLKGGEIFRRVMAAFEAAGYKTYAKLINELCHRKELNHSPRFWNEVACVMPDYAQHRKWLKENGGSLIARLK